tara:strand:- start:929 stop:1384 length:456 start_codon:yes stop_codon:yes gene_type:complete
MKDSKQLVRILNTDLDSNRNIYYGLCRIKGISNAFSNAICLGLNMSRDKLVKDLTKEEIAQIEKAVKQPELHPWLLNCQADYESGKDIHISTTDLKFRIDSNKKKLMRIKSYRGLRHAAGLPVRGQRTKANFRRTGKAVGVAKKKGAKKGK